MSGVAMVWSNLIWPPEVKPEQLLAAILALNGISRPGRRGVLVFDCIGSGGIVRHRLGVRTDRAQVVHQQLQTAIPGLAVEHAEDDTILLDRSWRAWISTKRRPLTIDDPQIISSAILTALSGTSTKEVLMARWLLGPVRRPLSVGNHGGATLDGPLSRTLMAPWMAPTEPDNQARTALRAKLGTPGWRADLTIGVHAEGRARQLQLLGHLAGAFRMAQGSSAQLGFRPTHNPRLDHLRLPFYWRLAVNVLELRCIIGLPIGDTAALPIRRRQSRPLAPVRGIPQHGIILGEATYPGREQPLALSLTDACMHTVFMGPTGSGKTSALINCIISQLKLGCGIAVIEPSDLINNVLASMPEHRLKDVVVIDPSDSMPVGLNPLAQRGVSPDLIADQILAVFEGIFGDGIGWRTRDILISGTLTLASSPGTSLVMLPRLFTDVKFRNQLLSRVNDPLGLQPFWQWWDALSASEKASVLAPLLNKLRVFLLRERVRRCLGQVAPKFDVNEVFTKRRALFVSLPTGVLGATSSSLIGSLVTAALWQAAQARVKIAPERRAPVFVTIDEAHRFLNLQTDIGDALAISRNLRTGWTLATQHLDQFPPSIRASVLANSRSRVVYRVGHDDARVFAQDDPRLTVNDFTGLGRYEAYVSVVVNGEVTPYASARTLPPPPVVRDPEIVREMSRQRWGVPIAEIDAAMNFVDFPETGVGRHTPEDTFGVIKRRGDET